MLEHACGAVPTTLFDTQLAAGFVGMSTPSLATTYERLLGRAGRQGRPPHRLAGPPADRQPAGVRGQRRGPPARGPRPAPRRARRPRAARLGARRVRAGAAPQQGPAGPRRGVAPHQGGPPAAGPVPRASCGRWRRGGSGGPRPSTSRCATCCPTWRWSGSSQRPPGNRRDLERVRGIDKGLRDDVAEELLAAVAEGLERPAPPPDGETTGGARPRPAPGGGADLGLGRPSWPTTWSSTPPCWRRGATSRRCCGATRTPGWPRAGGPRSWASRSGGWSPARRPWPSPGRAASRSRSGSHRPLAGPLRASARAQHHGLVGPQAVGEAGALAQPVGGHLDGPAGERPEDSPCRRGRRARR